MRGVLLGVRRPIVTETTQRPEPVVRDTFIDDLQTQSAPLVHPGDTVR